MFTRQFPEPVCKKCRYYVAECDAVKVLSEDRNDGRHICGQTILTEINELGDEVFRKYGDKEICGECGTLLNDHRRPIFQSCLVKNHLKKCKDFNPRPIFHILQDWVKSIIIKMMTKFNSIRINDFFVLLLILAFQILFVLYTDLYPLLNNKYGITFIVVEIILFGYLVKKK